MQHEAYTVPQFCGAYSISRALFYKLIKAGDGPETFTIGRKRLISRESAEKWLRRTEAASKSQRSVA